jgi:two-component system sensor histidine kinase ResE
MIWRNNIVVKLALTIILLVFVVLFILSLLLMQFFKNFYINETEEDMMDTASRVSTIIDQQEDRHFIQEAAELIKDPATRIAIIYPNGEYWLSLSSDTELSGIDIEWIMNEPDLSEVMVSNQKVQKQITLPDEETSAMIVGKPLLEEGAVYIYQSLDVINQTRDETQRIIWLSAGFAIILTVFFAVFLSTRVTSPLIKMREAAADLTRGEFNTKVPVLTHDELGDLAREFNLMGRQLKYHINALNYEKEQLSSIVKSMADGVITLNRNEDLIIINPPAEKYIEDWFFERNIERDKDENRLPDELSDALEKVIDGENEVLKEMNLQGRDYVMLVTPLYDGEHVRGAVAVIRDMTEDRRADKLRKDFIANVSHELRTPIALLQGYSEAIVDDVAETKEDKNELAGIIHEESLRMSRLVNDLLDIARMEAGHVQLEIETWDIEEYINRIVKKFQPIAEESQVDLRLSLNLQSNQASFDGDKVEQVFTNLIDNAIRHTNEHGYVEIKVEVTDTEFHAAITDNGSGIPEEDLPFVFERFYKADKARTRNKQIKGTGLGLAIAKNIIDSHDGIIRVQSKIGQGTTFIFTIPQNNLEKGM